MSGGILSAIEDFINRKFPDERNQEIRVWNLSRLLIASLFILYSILYNINSRAPFSYLWSTGSPSLVFALPDVGGGESLGYAMRFALGLDKKMSADNCNAHDETAWIKLKEIDSKVNSDDSEDQEIAAAKRDSCITILGSTRITGSNIVIVSIYAVFIATFTIRLGNEGRRKWYDSVYYLGFILTLLALIVALVSIDGSSSESMISLVVQNAIAMSSTFAALIWRTLLTLCVMPLEDNQDDSAQFDELRKKIDGLMSDVGLAAKAFTKLTKEVDSSASSITQSIFAFRSGIESAASSLQEKAKEINAIEIDQQIIAQQMAKAASLALDEVRTRIGEVSVAIGLAGDSIKSGASFLSSASIEASQEIKEAGRLFKSNVDQSGRDFNKATKAVEKALLNLAESISPEAISYEIEQKLRPILQRVALMIETEMNTVGQSLKGLTEEIDKGHDTVSTLRSAAIAILSEMIGRTNALSALNDSLDAILGRVEASLLDPKWYDEQRSQQQTLSAALQSLREQIATATARTEVASRTVADAALDVRKAVEDGKLWAKVARLLNWITGPFRR